MFVDSAQHLPKVTVITVVYNAGHLLERTIQSVAAQTYTPLEYIVIDGASTDHTLDIIRKHPQTIDYWISEPDQGIYDAMNKGLRLSTGDYVWFINAGDEIYARNTLKNIMNTSDNADAYYGETMITDAEGHEIGLRRLRPGGTVSWKSLRKGMVISHQSFIVKKTLAPPYRLQFKYAADFDWMLRCLKASRNISNTQQILSRFMDGGRTKQTILPGLKERFHIMAAAYGWLPTLLQHIPIAWRFFVFYVKEKRF